MKKAISKEKLEKSYKQAWLQHGAQPSTSRRQERRKAHAAQARLKVVGDKRAGNWQELEAELKGEGAEQRGDPDSEKAASPVHQRCVCLYDVISEDDKVCSLK